MEGDKPALRVLYLKSSDVVLKQEREASLDRCQYQIKYTVLPLLGSRSYQNKRCQFRLGTKDWDETTTDSEWDPALLPLPPSEVSIDG
jgi:hypothetical protein